MRSKGDGSKKGGRKKLVNIISKLAKEKLDKSNEDGIIEKENVSVNNKDTEDEGDDDDCVVIVEPSPPESKRRSKRKPDKTAKSTPNPVSDAVHDPVHDAIHDPVHDLITVGDPDQVTTDILDNNLTIVKALPSDDEFEETPQDEKMSNQTEEKVKKKKSDFKEQNDTDLKVVNCTACNKNIVTKRGKFCRHPDLNTIICKSCYKFYSSGKFTKDEYGVEEFCRWCADGGELICCDFCEKAFCKKCIKRNLGKSKLKELLEADEDEKWKCFCCNPAPISDIIKLCKRVMRVLDEEKDQHSPYKDRKGREFIHGPNRSERRNILTNLSDQRTTKKKANTHLNFKKTYSMRSQNGDIADVLQNKENSDDNDIEQVTVEQVTVKKEREEKCKSDVTTVESGKDNDVSSDELSGSDKVLKSNKKMRITENSSDEPSGSDKVLKSNKKKSLRITENSSDEPSGSDKVLKSKKKKRITENSSDEPSGSDKVLKSNKKSLRKTENSSAEPSESDKVLKSNKKKSLRKTENSSAESSESDKVLKSNKKMRKTESSSDSDSVQKKKRKKQEKNPKSTYRVKIENKDANSSSEEEIGRSKKKKQDKKENGNSKSDRKRIDRDSADDIVQTKNKKGTRKKKFAVSSDEEQTDEETDPDERADSSEQESSEEESSVQESSEPSVKRRKRNSKKNRKRDIQSSDSDSDVADSPKKHKKKGSKKVGKWSLRGKSGANITSDSESEKENVRKSKSKKKVNAKKKGKLKRKRKRGDDGDDDESDDENASPKKGRKKIRKILKNEKLTEATRHARQLEEERRQRLVERTKSVVYDKPDSIDVKEVVLEYKSDGKTPLVEVGEDLVQHLKPHQVEGVKFMYDCTIESVERWKKKEPGGGCILAHVMGLGKTLQVVSLVHTLYASDLVKLRRVLVVCPLNTVLNWQNEFEKWLSVDDRLDIYVLNEATGNWNRADMMKQWMNYGGILIMGYTMYRNLSQCLRVKSKHQKKIFKESLVDPGPELVVCDEGHILRNCKSGISIAMNGIKTKRRIVLSGTPLQNNLLEYHCMVSFVKPNLLGTSKEFSNSFIRPIENGQCADSTLLDVKIMKRRCHVLHKMLDGCVQRKDYAEIKRFLPPKFEYVIKIRLSAKQREIYKYYLDTFLSDEENKGKGGTLFSDYQALMRIWTHPWALKLESARQIERFIDSDDSLKDFVVGTDEEESEASEEMSWTSDESDNGKRGKTRSKSTSGESEDDDGSEEDDSEEETPKISNKRRSEKQTDEKKTSRNAKANSDGPSTSKASVVVDVSDDDIVEVKPDVDNTDGVSMVASKLRSGQDFKDPLPVEEEEEWYDKFLTQEDEKNVELGSKIVLLLEILADAAALEEKVLVFSHSLISLDVIEMALGGGEIGGNTEDWCRGCDYFRMDGSTSVQMRKRWSDIFNDEQNKAARLFLISTKAGGLGINLVGACRVVVFDVSWNPSHDVQSIFRAYRFGQNKPVFIYRFIAEGTMEEKIYDRQVTKLSMSQRVIDEHQIQRHFNANDLTELYRFEPDILENENDERPTPAVPKDAVLAELINRLYPKYIVKYHEHDSLLENRPEEELTEAERKEAWEQWEQEKQGILNESKIRAENMQQMMNGVRMPILIDGPNPNPGISGARQFTLSGPRVPAPHGVPTFAGAQRPPNYQQIILEEQRRRLFEMETRRVREESERLARANALRLQQQQLEKQRAARELAAQTHLREQQRQRLEQQRQLSQQQRLREQQQREQQQRAQQQRAQQQRAQQQREQQEKERQQREKQLGQQFLQQLLRNQNAYVTQQTGQGHPNQRVFQVVMDNDGGNNPAQSQRRQRSPPRIIELPPDA